MCRIQISSKLVWKANNIGVYFVFTIKTIFNLHLNNRRFTELRSELLFCYRRDNFIIFFLYICKKYFLKLIFRHKKKKKIIGFCSEVTCFQFFELNGPFYVNLINEYCSGITFIEKILVKIFIVSALFLYTCYRRQYCLRYR